MSRPDGFYWVRTLDGAQELWRMHGGIWQVPCDEYEIHPEDSRAPLVVSGRLTEPGERMGQDELERTLVFLARINGYALRGELDDLEAKAPKKASP